MLLRRFCNSASVPPQQNVSSSGCGVNSRMVFCSTLSSWKFCAVVFCADMGQAAIANNAAAMANFGFMAIGSILFQCEPRHPGDRAGPPLPALDRIEDKPA